MALPNSASPLSASPPLWTLLHLFGLHPNIKQGLIIMKNCFTKKPVSQFPLFCGLQIIGLPVKDRAFERL
jgi:hypothetical protein